jgi:nucleotide-binding universal stress UspA family protein
METSRTTRPGTVVVAYDGSDHAEHALRWAADEAALEGRTLSVVHVVKPLTGYELSASVGAWAPPDEVRKAIWSDAGHLLASVRDRLRDDLPNLDVELVLAEGDARQVLLDLSATASSLFLGSRGRGQLASLLLGSVSVAVSRATQCPTFVIRPHHPGRVRNGVVVGTDCTEQSLATLEFAYRQASLRGLPLTVVHCLGGTDPVSGVGAMIDDGSTGFEDERLRLAESVAGFAEKFSDVPVRLRLCHGVADTCLIRESARMDLVVVGHHQGRAFGDLIHVGSFATPVVESAECPVVVVSEHRTG